MRWISLFSLVSCMSCSHSESTAHVSLPKPGYEIVENKDGLPFHTGLKKKPAELKGLGELHVHLAEADCANLPETYDLRPTGVVSPVRDQEQCGSCWAHAMTEGLESARRTAGGTSVKLSVQELVSNDSSNWGCSGGLMQPEKAYQVLHGQGLDSDFAYRAVDLQAKQIPMVQKAESWAFVGQAGRTPTVKEVKCALVKNHSTPWVTVGASNAWGSPPTSETSTYRYCGNTQTNHAVTIVGWNKQGWIMMNSWGVNWGANGYMTIPFGSSGNMGVCDNFGDEVAFVTVKSDAPCKPPMVALPAVVTASAGVEVLVGVKDNTAALGWTYAWFQGTTKVGVGPHLYVTPTGDAVYKLVANSKCGTAESSVQIKLISAK